MKRSIGILSILFSLSIIAPISISGQERLQRVKASLPSFPSLPTFNLQSLTSHETITQAITKLASAFRYLSPQTLQTVAQRQTNRFKRNIDAYLESDSITDGMRAISNALASVAATIAGSAKAEKE